MDSQIQRLSGRPSLTTLRTLTKRFEKLTSQQVHSMGWALTLIHLESLMWWTCLAQQSPPMKLPCKLGTTMFLSASKFYLTEQWPVSLLQREANGPGRSLLSNSLRSTTVVSIMWSNLWRGLLLQA